MDDKNIAHITYGIEYAKGFPCLLCEGDPVGVLLWRPLDNVRKQMGEPEGKDRLVAYTLCNECLKIENVMELVAEKIKREAGVTDE